MPRRIVAAKPPKAKSTAIPIPTELNISALARDAGVSRKTMRRRLEKGWRPDVPTPAPTPAHGRPGRGVRILKGRDLGKSTAMPVFTERPPLVAPMRPPLGVVRTVLLLVAVGFYVFIAVAAVHR